MVNVYLPKESRRKLEGLQSIGVVSNISDVVQRVIDDLAAEHLPWAIEEQINKREIELEDLKEIQKRFILKDGEKKTELKALVASFKRHAPGKGERILLEWIDGRRTDCFQVFGKMTDIEYLEELRSRAHVRESV